MWTYDKRLEYPVKVKKPNPAMAKIIITQIGGPDGEAGAAMRYLSQRYAAPDNTVRAILTDIGTEESRPTLTHHESKQSALFILHLLLHHRCQQHI